MENVYELLKKIIEKCTFEYDGFIISKEYLMKSYYDFLAQTINISKHSVGVILHTGSVCFDVVSVLFASITSIIFCDQDSENIIYSLNLGDTVLYGKDKQQRYIFEGFYDKNGLVSKDFILLSQPNIRRNIPKKLWNKIQPYNGNSKSLDGKGIRKKNYSRGTFIANILEINENDVPSLSDKSIVIVMSRDKADKILNNLKIIHEDSIISLLEMITASYFTESDQYCYSGNPGKIEPILKVTGKISVARDLVMERSGNKTIGIFILDDDNIAHGGTELIELMERKSLRYVFVACNIDFNNAKQIIEECENTKVFACTKECLEPSMLGIVENNKYTRELSKQVNILFEKKINTLIVSGNEIWNEILKIKKAILYLKNSDFISEQKDYFIIQAYSMVNLFLTSAFPIRNMEEMIENGELNIISPKVRFDELQKASLYFPDILQVKIKYILEQLAKIYKELYINSEKYNVLIECVQNSANKKTAIIVPKAYYVKILYAMKIQTYMWDETNLMITTVNKFDNSVLYDEIIVLGDINGKKFDIFRCKASLNITVLIYEFEKTIFNYKSKESKKLERLYSKKAGLIQYSIEPEEIDIIKEAEAEAEYTEVQEVDLELEKYILQINEWATTQFISKSANGNSGIMADVVAIGTFVDGEKIFFTKSYRAYIFDEIKEDVYESDVRDLNVGDTLIFTNNTQITKDIVDIILEQLICNNLTSLEVKEAYEKSKYWKLLLKQYKNKNNLTYHQLALLLGEYGSSKHEVTIRSWFDEESHIVGPKDSEIFQQIAQLTGNKKMLKDTEGYRVACSIIRSMRVKILKKIGISIINKIKGKKLENDSLLEIVYDNVNDLAMMMQLIEISEAKIKVPVNLTNRPLVI